MELKDKLNKYGLTVFYKENHHNSSDPDDYYNIDFSIDDGEDNIAWVWGDTPDKVDWECNHGIVEYGDDDEQGECVLCGAVCDWHWEKETIDNYPDSIEVREVQEPHEWYYGTEPKGLIKEILDSYRQEDNGVI